MEWKIAAGIMLAFSMISVIDFAFEWLFTPKSMTHGEYEEFKARLMKRTQR